MSKIECDSQYGKVGLASLRLFIYSSIHHFFIKIESEQINFALSFGILLKFQEKIKQIGNGNVIFCYIVQMETFTMDNTSKNRITDMFRIVDFTYFYFPFSILLWENYFYYRN